MHLLLVRHGQTEWNRLEKFQGQTDIMLNETGREQAQQLSQIAGKVPLDMIFTSQLGRTVETAQPLASKLGLEIRRLEGLNETKFGDLEGMTLQDMEKNRLLDVYKRYRSRDLNFRLPNGESIAERYARVTMALHTAIDAAQGRHTMIVAHGGVLDDIVRHLLGIPLEVQNNLVIDNCRLGIFKRASASWRMLGWGLSPSHPLDFDWSKP